MELFSNRFHHATAQIFKPDFNLGVYGNEGRRTQFDNFVVRWAHEILEASNDVGLIRTLGVWWVSVEFKFLGAFEDLHNMLVDGLGVLGLANNF